MDDEGCRIYPDAMTEIYMMAVHNLKVARDRCPPLTWDPDKAEFKVEKMVLLKKPQLMHLVLNVNPASESVNIYLTKLFDIQDSKGNVRCVSIHHLQLLHPAEHVLTQLPDMASFGRTMKYINLPLLMPNLYSPTSVHRTNRKMNKQHINES